MQQRLVLEKLRWDHLIVLDACRYDALAEEWRGGGRLMPVLSPASWTLEWLDRVFGDKWVDATVVSASPYISSGGEIRLHGIRWRASDHFPRIVDLWLTAWDDELGTVPPEKVYVAAALHASMRGGRIMAWFMQPHYPYLYKPFLDAVHRVSSHLSPRDFLEGGLDRAMRMVISLLAESDPGVLRKAYRVSLRRVLRSVYRLISRLEGTVVVTSDHGELLGESLVRQAVSTILNLLSQSLEEGTHVYFSRRIRAAAAYLASRRGAGSSRRLPYIAGGRIYMHPPVMYSSVLRKVPLVVVG